MKLPNNMMVMLRGRYNLDETDTRMDAEIVKLKPAEIVRECSAWRLGDPLWAVVFAEWMKAAGCKPEDLL